MTKKINITYVIGSLDRGGCETHLLRTLPLLDTQQFVATVVTLSHRGELATALEKNNISVIGYDREVKSGGYSQFVKNRLHMLRMVTILFRHYVVKKPDITHFYLPFAYLLGFPVAKAAGVSKRVMSRRSLNYYQEKKPLAARLERFFHRYIDKVCANSKAIEQQLINDERVDRDKIHLIYNGVPQHQPGQSREAMREALQIGQDVIVITIVANLIHYKGHVDLIRALAMIGSDKPWQCLIVGEDRGILSELKTLVASLRLQTKIKFLGKRLDVVNIYEASDIAVLASHEEGLSNAILEAMAARLPMVVTDVGGNSELVSHGETGFVVPARRPEAFARALVQLIDNQQLRKTLGEAGCERVSQDFSLSACAENYMKLYRNLMS